MTAQRRSAARSLACRPASKNALVTVESGGEARGCLGPALDSGVDAGQPSWLGTGMQRRGPGCPNSGLRSRPGSPLLPQMVRGVA